MKIAYLASAVAVLAAPQVWATVSQTAPSAVVSPPGEVGKADRKAGDDHPSKECLAKYLCELKERVRWRTPAWQPEVCERMATIFTTAAEEHRVPIGLLVATALNESSLVDDAVREYYRMPGGALEDRRTRAGAPPMLTGHLESADGGLGGIRCVFGAKALAKGEKICTNGALKGVPWKDVLDPATNVNLMAKMLSKFRNGDGASAVEDVVVRQGKVLRSTTKPCSHRDHAFWSHYNHGPRFNATGRSRHYAHRVAVLWAAFERALGMPRSPDLNGVITVKDKGEKARSVDKPVGERYRLLSAKLFAAGPACSAIASNRPVRNDASLVSVTSLRP